MPIECAAYDCHETFTPRKPWHRFHSTECRKRAWLAGYEHRYGVNYDCEASRDRRAGGAL